MPATATGRGAQVIIDPASDTALAIRGAWAPTMEENAAKVLADVMAGDVSSGFRPDGTTRTGDPAVDYMVTSKAQMAVPTPAGMAAGAASAANPSGTNSVNYVMQGVGVTTSAPANATRAVVLVSGQIGNSNNNGQAYAQLCYGTGDPPGDGDPFTGTPIGNEVHMVSTTGAATGGYVPFSQNALVTGLTPGTTYWFSIALHAAAGGTANLVNVQIVVFTLIDATQ